VSERPGTIRIAIVDDHPVARYGMQLIFDADPGIEVVHAGDSLAGMQAWLRSGGGDADMVILDLYLSHGRLAEPEIAEAARDRPVLVVSASARPADVLTAIRAGAAGYLVKSSPGEAFIEAVRTVAGRGFYVSSQLADLIHTTDGRLAPAAGQVRLAPREREALSLIAQGFTQAQAASRMGISPATIDTYIKRIRTKLGPGNKADLTRRAIELGQVTGGLDAEP
jgi:two-component system, NarL family, nitrate/nitrite response regulator NarL